MDEIDLIAKHHIKIKWAQDAASAGELARTFEEHEQASHKIEAVQQLIEDPLTGYNRELTEIELESLRMAFQGMSYIEMGKARGVAWITAADNCQRAMAKVGIENKNKLPFHVFRRIANVLGTQYVRPTPVLRFPITVPGYGEVQTEDDWKLFGLSYSQALRTIKDYRKREKQYADEIKRLKADLASAKGGE